jgi:hypothetical protein
LNHPRDTMPADLLVDIYLPLLKFSNNKKNSRT